MRNLLALLAAGTLAVGGFGWYLGWFTVQTSPAPNGHINLNVNVDGQKAAADSMKGISKAVDLAKTAVDQAQKKAEADAQKSAEAKPQGEPASQVPTPAQAVTRQPTE